MKGIKLESPTLLSMFDDLSARRLAPEGSVIEVVAPIYSGSVLLVEWEGKMWYTPNNGLAPHLDTRKPKPIEAPNESKSPWDAPWKRRKKTEG